MSPNTLGLAAVVVMITKERVALGIVKARVQVAKSGMKDSQFVIKVAQKAESSMGGTGRFAGTAKQGTEINTLILNYNVSPKTVQVVPKY